MTPRLPNSVQGTFIGAMVAASLLFCCALYSGAGAAFQLTVGSQIGIVEGGDPMMARMLEMQRTGAILSVIVVTLQLACALGLVVGGALGLQGRPIGRMLTLVAFGLLAVVVLAEIGVALWSWSQMQGMFAGLGPGMGEEEARIAMIAGMTGMVPTMCWVFLQLALIAVGTGVLVSSEARTFYATVGPEGLRPGPRG